MRRNNRRRDNGGGDSWLNTYADMVTLLLTFFVVMLSMSTVNQEKYNAFVRSFSNLPQEVIEEITNPAVEPGDEEVTELDDSTDAPLEQSADIQASPEALQAMNDLYKMLVKYVEENGMADSVSINKIGQVIFIKFDSSVFFEPDKYIMLTGGKDTLSFIGDGIKEYENMVDLVAICGHTATVPDHSSYVISDWMLSGERAASVAMFLEDEKSIDPKKMILVGYGKNLPIATNDTEDGRKENRRVELIVVGSGSDISFDPYSDLSELYSMGENETVDTPASDTTGAEESANPDIQKNVSPYD